MNRTCGYNQGFLKVGEIVRIWCRKFKKMLQKMIKIIRKDSRISKIIIIKVASIVKNCLRFMKILVTV